jgi:hypothetical protein
MSSFSPQGVPLVNGCCTNLSSLPLSKSLVLVGNDRIFRAFNLVLNTFMIGYAIYSFPRHPRLSLVTVVVYMVLSLVLVILWASNVLALKIYGTLSKLLDLMENVEASAASVHDYIERTEPSHSEAHQAITAAIGAVHNTTLVLANRAPDDLTPPATDTPPPETAKPDDKEEPNGGS